MKKDLKVDYNIETGLCEKCFAHAALFLRREWKWLLVEVFSYFLGKLTIIVIF